MIPAVRRTASDLGDRAAVLFAVFIFYITVIALVRTYSLFCFVREVERCCCVRFAGRERAVVLFAGVDMA